MTKPRWHFVRSCPSCGSFEVRRSHRRGLFEVMILPMLLLRPFRCDDCLKRHFNLFFTEALPLKSEKDRAA